ncbi:MAG: ECF transporter S component [Lachnospiraceae bacterium]|nr:ECF transporter S component [Lachnospiraceae bacterium]
MSELKNIKVIVTGAMLAAMTCVATMVIKIPTPTTGYVHLGDCFVLLAGFLLGPAAGGLAAGTGSMLSDLLSGYAVWAPGTFVIKLATASVAAGLYSWFSKRGMKPLVNRITSSIAGEMVMITGYFLYNIIILTVINTGGEAVALASAITQSAAEIPFNVAQGITGIVLSVILLPVFEKVVSLE